MEGAVFLVPSHLPITLGTGLMKKCYCSRLNLFLICMQISLVSLAKMTSWEMFQGLDHSGKKAEGIFKFLKLHSFPSLNEYLLYLTTFVVHQLMTLFTGK